MRKSVLVIQGEKSGIEHARSFLPEIISQKQEYSFFGVGDSESESWGVELLFDLQDFSSMGFSEVFLKLPFYLSARKKILSEVKKRNTKYAILIDFQSFNTSLLKHLDKLGVKIFYYVAPQAWAWKEKRVYKFKKYVNDLFCILPFEKKWFENRGLKRVHYVSHPLIEKKYEIETKRDAKEVAILPGSRNSEVKYLLPVFIEFIKKNKNYSYTLIKSKNVNPKFYELYDQYFDFIVYSEDLTKVLSRSSYAIAASGTVTLECALAHVPTIVCYKVSLFNEYIFNNFVKYRGFVSISNIVLGREVFPELLQEKCTPFLINKYFEKISKKYSEIKKDLEKVSEEFHSNKVDTVKMILEGME